MNNSNSTSGISAALVKELRDRTNAGFMECKKALTEAEGDIEKAMQILEESGQAKAAKKASRIAKEGIVVTLSAEKSAVLVEINCETDFVAREEKFKNFAKKVAEQALERKIKTIEELQQETETLRLGLVAQLGENITVRRLAYYEMAEGVIGTYTHGDANGVRIGALVALKKGTESVARDLAMQVAAMDPDSESTLLSQALIKDPNQTIESYLQANGAVLQNFVRFAVGEGIDKPEDNFVQEVMAQVRGA